mgnify:CR=1 FL=1
MTRKQKEEERKKKKKKKKKKTDQPVNKSEKATTIEHLWRVHITKSLQMQFNFHESLPISS